MFIPESHQYARQWVDACVASLNIDPLEASAMFANMCGFPSWDVLMSKIGTERPSPVDSALGLERLLERREQYAQLLVDIFAFNPSYAVYFIEHLSPSQGGVPKKIAINQKSIHEPDEEGVINLHMPGIDQPGVMDQMAKEVFGDALGEDFNFDNFSDRMRISMPVEPADTFNLFANIGFEPIEDSFQEDYQYLTPSFWVRHPSSVVGNAEIPVYLTSLSYVPLDHADRMAQEFLDRVLDDASDHMETPEIIACWGNHLHKDQGKHCFTNAGAIYTKGEWKHFLICENVNSVETLFSTIDDIGDYNNPSDWFLDLNKTYRMIYLSLSLGLECIEGLKDYRFLSTGSHAGWVTIIPTAKK